MELSPASCEPQTHTFLVRLDKLGPETRGRVGRAPLLGVYAGPVFGQSGGPRPKRRTPSRAPDSHPWNVLPWGSGGPGGLGRGRASGPAHPGARGERYRRGSAED